MKVIDVPCRCLLAPHRCGVQGQCRVRGRTCGFLKPLNSNELWRVRQHGAFPIPHEAPGIQMWFHLDFVERRNGQAHHERHERRLLLKERSAPYHYSKQNAPNRRGCKRPFAFSIDQGDHLPQTQARFTMSTSTPADLHRRAHVTISMQLSSN